MGKAGRKKVLTDEQIFQAIERAKAGEPHYRIADSFGVSQTAVSKYIREVGGIRQYKRRSQDEIERGGDLSKNSVVTSASGEAHSIFEWAELTKMNPQTILGRMKSGMDIDAAISSEVREATIVTAGNGESRTISEWSEITGISKSKIYGRYVERGWTADQSLGFEPEPHKILVHDGKAYSLADLARVSGASIATVYYRIRKGMPFSEIIAPTRNRGARAHRSKATERENP